MNQGVLTGTTPGGTSTTGNSVAVGDYQLFSTNQPNLVTLPNGNTFLKSGVIAPASSYPTVPSANTAYLNPVVPVSSIGSGGRWVSIAISESTGYPTILSDSPQGLYTIMYGLSTTSNTDCTNSTYGANVSTSEANDAYRYKKISYYRGYLVATYDSSLVTNGSSSFYAAGYQEEPSIYDGQFLGTVIGGNALNAIASNPTGAIVLLYNGSSSTNLYNPSVPAGYGTGTLPSTGVWTCCAWGSSLFVALRTGVTNAASSPNGLTWTARTMPSASAWTAVASSGTLFVAVASGGTAAASSADGITWTARTLPVSANWSAVTYSSTLSLWCAVASDSSIAATSPDGITWTQRVLPASAYWADVKWSPALAAFIACASDGLAGVAFSLDGIAWATKAMPRVVLFPNLMAAGSNTFYSMGDTTGSASPVRYGSLPIAAKSTDNGLTWKYYVPNIALGYSGSGGSVFADSGFRYGGGRIYCGWGASGNLGCRTATSTDGITWTLSTSLGTYYNIQDMAYNGTNYLATTYGSSTSAATTAAFTSPDGLTWTLRNLSISRNWGACTAAGTVFLVVAYSTTTPPVARSTDNGVTWTFYNATYQAQYANNMVYDPVRALTFITYNNSWTQTSNDAGITWIPTPAMSANYQFIYPGWVNAGNGTYVGYSYGTAYVGTAAGILGIATASGVNTVLPYAYSTGYGLYGNRTGMYAHNSTAPPLPQIQSGNYYTDGKNILKMDTQKYIDNVNSAGERNGYNTGIVLQYYMRVK